jgi:hypothetical protein
MYMEQEGSRLEPADHTFWLMAHVYCTATNFCKLPGVCVASVDKIASEVSKW